MICVGLALDFCERYSAEDACEAGFNCVVIESACRGIDLGGSMEAARTIMRKVDVILM